MSAQNLKLQFKILRLCLGQLEAVAHATTHLLAIPLHNRQPSEGRSLLLGIFQGGANH
ncbi:hypothetical protein D9M69_718250 [compost metagenome]